VAEEPQDETDEYVSKIVLTEPTSIEDFVAIGADFATEERIVRWKDMLLNRRIAKLKADHAKATKPHIKARDMIGAFIMKHAIKQKELVFGSKASAELGPIKVTDYEDKRKTFSPGNLDELAAELREIPELSDLVSDVTEVVVTTSVDVETLKQRLIDNPELLEKVTVATLTTNNRFKIELPLNEREKRDKVKNTTWERPRPDTS
jgi:hypothetical protein